MAHFIVQTLLVYALIASGVSALYSEGDAVVALNGKNFEELVDRADGVAMVEFYAPWCGHCQQLAPQYKKVASNLKGLALVGAVDCTDQATNGDLCLRRFKLRGFPSIMVFGPDKEKNPYTGAVIKQHKDYEGPRTAKPMVDAVTALLDDRHITRLGSQADLQAFAQAAGPRPQVLLFTSKPESTPLYKSLSTQLHARLAFGQVHAPAAPELVQEFGVQDVPALLVVKADGSREVYGGELKAPALLKHLTGLAGGGGGGGDAQGQAGKAGRKAGKSGPAEAAFVRQVYDLSELPALDAREDMALLAMHGAEGPDGCSDARDSFLRAAGEMQAVVDTMLVSVPAADLAPESEGAKTLGRLGVDVAALASDPCELQVVLLPLGKDKADLDDYQRYSGPPDGKALQRWVTDAIPAYFVTRLDDNVMGGFLQLDPSNGRMAMAPKVLLFTNKDEAPALYRALAMALRNRGNLLFAWVQVGGPATKRVVATFNPTKVPSIMVVAQTPAEPGEETPPGGTKLGQTPYNGPMKYTPMRAFLENVAASIESMSGVVDDPVLAEKALPQVSSQADFEAHCASKAGLCLLALLDSTAPSYEEERQELIRVALGAARGGDTFHFAWMEGRRHRSAMQAFGVLASDLPTLVALSAKRLRFAVLPAPEVATKGAKLNPEAIARFVNGVLEGKIRTQALQALPQIRSGDDAPTDDVAAAAAAGGASADAAAAAAEEPAEPIEEEFDLSDIMSEEVEGGVVGGKADRLQEVEERLRAEEEARKAAEAAAKAKKAKKSKKSKKSKKAKASGASSEEL